MAINHEQFEADLENLANKYGIDAMLVMAHAGAKLDIFTFGYYPHVAGMQVVLKHTDKMLDDIQPEVEEAIRNAARNK